MSEVYYKLLNRDGTTPLGHGKWPLPDGYQPGEWLPPIEGVLLPCMNGYHILTWDQLLTLFWNGEHLYEIGVDGEVIDAGAKCVCRHARTIRRIKTWNDRNLRLFVCDCVERVLHVFENQAPDDARPRRTIETARRFALGLATSSELTAAKAAARAAAENVALTAAGAAAENVALTAAGAAAENVALTAAGDVAWAAAGAVAGGVALAAAGAVAGGVALAAAGDVAWAAAGDVAWAAERQWQRDHLASYLTGAIA